MEEGKFLAFDQQKVQAISLAQLERTHRENNLYEQPLYGIYHFDLIHKVIDICNQQNLNADVWDLFAAHNKDRNSPGVVLLPQIEEKFGPRAVEAHILRRVFANIRLTDFDDDTYTTNLSVSFHQKGIQIGFGNNVKICHNQCMLGASKYATNYGNDKITIAEMLDALKSWIADARRIVMEDREKIEQMKSIEVSAEQCFTLIGMLTSVRIAHDTRYPEIRNSRTYPLNQSQISDWTEDLMLRYKRNGSVSVWDLYNSATNLYKADKMDIPQILPQNIAMANFLEGHFGI